MSDIVALYKEDIVELRILQKLHNFATTNTKNRLFHTCIIV